MSFRRGESNRRNRTRENVFTSVHAIEKHPYAQELEDNISENNYVRSVKINENDDPPQPIIHLFGENSAGFKGNAVLQNYEELLAYHQENKTLFCDESFSPENIALKQGLKLPVEWKRPLELSSQAEFIKDGASRFDVMQGSLGDCWFLAAIANLTTNKQLFEFVVPRNQITFSDPKYAGIFHFRFWQYGHWVDIVVDDRLPTVDGKLLYLRSADPDEFWTALLEKAYAKLYGSYKNIEGGQITEALEDLCGGLSEFYPANFPGLYFILLTSYERLSLMGCFITSDVMEETLPDGLISNHAYSITKIVNLSIDDSNLVLIRIRNPWGGSEWTGDWSDRSELWNSLPEEIRNQLRLLNEDGEFWMDFRDFQERFTYVDICHLNPNAFTFSDDSKRWHISAFEGVWIPNVTAGGGFAYKETFANNPQYFITIDGNKDDTDKQYAVVIGLMQKFRRLLGEHQLPLEIAVFAVNTLPGQLLDKNFFAKNEPIAHSAENSIRQLTVRLFLPPGHYCIIPSTKKPNSHVEYLLRVFAEIDTPLTENDDEVTYTSGIQDSSIKEVAVKMVDRTFRKSFRKVAGNQREIGYVKVTKILNKVYKKRSANSCFGKSQKMFSKETCRSIVALWDRNYSGTLDYDEFWKLMTDVATLQIIFKKFDKDQSGKLDGFELRELFSECGFKVNKQILNIIMMRYGTNGLMSFQNFVVSAFKLKSMIDEFHQRQSLQNSVINLSKDEWLHTTLYK